MDSLVGGAEETSAILGSLCQKGVRVWLENNKLRYKAPRGALGADDIVRLRSSSQRLVCCLKKLSGDVAGARGHPGATEIGHAPLAFSQQAHWRQYDLPNWRSMRWVTTAIRIRGVLDVDALRRSIEQLVLRHDALRTRLAVVEGTPIQVTTRSIGCALEYNDLKGAGDDGRDRAAARLTAQLVEERIDVRQDSLWALLLLRLSETEHRLVIAAEHIVSDGASLSVFTRELLEAYSQASNGREFSLPLLPFQFPDYATWQRYTHGAWLKQHSRYLQEHLGGCGRLRFPTQNGAAARSSRFWDAVPVSIGPTVTAQLRAWCRMNNTTLAMAVFASYVALVLRWCDAHDAVFTYQSDGREDVRVQNVIGFFAAPLYLRIALSQSDNFTDLLEQITHEYCRAHEHIDFSYLMAQDPKPDFTRNTAFNWLPDQPFANGCKPCGSTTDITCSPVHVPRPAPCDIYMDCEPSILLRENCGQISGEIQFPADRFSAPSMETLRDALPRFILQLMAQPRSRVCEVPLKGPER